MPLETRGAIARYDEQRDILELHGAAKVPHWNRDTLAQMLGRKRQSVQLYEGHVGGGFGIRGEIYPEDVLVCAAALKFRKAIKWIEDRREHLIAANHSREQHHKVRAAIDARGQILAIDDEFFHDNGAYMRTHAATVPDLAAAMLPGPYRVPAYRAVGHIRLTNKTPCGTYRAPGRYESSFVRERLLDAIAAKVGVDKVEIRRRNLIAKSAMPYALGLETLGTKIVYDSGDYSGLLDKALALADWKNLQKQLLERRRAGEKVGAGVAMFVEKSGLGPFDTVRVEIIPGGTIEVITGVASLGQGVETVVAQICADALGVNYSDIKVIHGQTDRIDKGMGAFASRVTVMCGEATRLAATKLRAEVLELAAELMQSKADLLDIVDGQIVRRQPRLGACSGARGTRREQRAPLSAEATFESAHMVYPYGVHIAAVRVDADTGGVAVERYAIAYDIGKAVNPKLVEGQIAGGLAQGIGGALLEEFLYDDNGEPLSVSFRRLSDADGPRNPGACHPRHRGCAEPAQSARPQGRRRRRRQSGRRGDRVRHRRRASAPRRGDAIAGHAAAAEGADADLSLEVRAVAVRGLFDAAGERRADVPGHHQRTARRAIVEHLAPADARLRHIGVFREIPIGIIDLQQMMPDVTDEGGALALAFELEEHVTGRVAGRGIDLDKVVNAVRTLYHVGLAVFEDRHHAFAERAEFGRAFLRIGIDLGEVVDVRLVEDVTRIGKRRHPFAVALHRIPADMIVMQMRAHHHVDVLRPRAGGGQPLQIRLVEPMPERTAGLVLVVAAAAVDQDGLAADLQQPAMDGEP